jgi:hypothetical protein
VKKSNPMSCNARQNASLSIMTPRDEGFADIRRLKNGAL